MNAISRFIWSSYNAAVSTEQYTCLHHKHAKCSEALKHSFILMILGVLGCRVQSFLTRLPTSEIFYTVFSLSTKQNGSQSVKKCIFPPFFTGLFVRRLRRALMDLILEVLEKSPSRSFQSLTEEPKACSLSPSPCHATVFLNIYNII